jgi:lysyl-tRNA synthetase class I
MEFMYGVTKFDRGARTMTIKTTDGTEETYRLTEHATEDAGKDTEDTAKKSAHATVYYSEEAGHKVAHFFKTS